LKACGVYLVWHHLLLRDTVRAILQQDNLSVVGESHGVDPSSEIFALHPDVVLVEDEGGWTEKLLEIMPRLKSTHLVSINMADNKLYIYHCEERMLNQMGDLTAALKFSP